jgi:hypothetical protein
MQTRASPAVALNQLGALTELFALLALIAR